MFSTLLESRSARERPGKGGAASLIFHVLVGSLAVYATAAAHGGRTIVDHRPNVIFVDPKKAPAQSKLPNKPVRLRLPTPRLPAPIDIPDQIPDVDMTKPVTNADDWRGTAVTGEATSASATTAGGGDTYSAKQVERQASVVPGSPIPRYPEVLTSAGVEGQVSVEFVVDTTGRADMSTFKVLSSAHDAFSEEVRSAVARMRFYPAEAGGRRVKELVQIPFTFALKK